MKKKKRNFIIKVFSLLLLGILSITLLGSWSYDPATDTITSDNLCNSIDGIGYNINFGMSTIEENKTYSFKCYDFQPDTVNYSVILYINGNQYYIIAEPSSYNTSIVSGFTFTTPNTPLPEPITSIYITVQFNVYVTVIGKCMINEGNLFLPYEPYGQTYVNKTLYDSLYEDWESVTEDYNTLVSEFDSLQADYNTLNTAYEQLEINYDNAIDDLDQLRDEMNDLQSQYNALQSQYNNIMFFSNVYDLFNGGYNYVFDQINSDLNWYINHLSSAVASGLNSNLSTNDSIYDLNNLSSSVYNYIIDSPEDSGHYIIMLPLSHITKNGIVIEFNDYTFNFEINLFNSKTNDVYTYALEDVSYRTNVVACNPDNNEFDFIFIDGKRPDYNFIKIYLTQESSLYNMGFNEASKQLNSTIDLLNSNIRTLNNTISIKNAQISNLQQQVDNALGWKPLFFAMADTPFKVVANVLGFEVFGVNLFKVFVGIITGLAIIWLLKKLLGK